MAQVARKTSREERFSSKKASRFRNFQFALAIGSICETRQNIFFREMGKIAQNVGVGHSAGQVFQHIIDSDAQPPNAGFPAAFAGLNGNDVRVRHVPTVWESLVRAIGKL
jgi:hypothetical protein